MSFDDHVRVDWSLEKMVLYFRDKFLVQVCSTYILYTY